MPQGVVQQPPPAATAGLNHQQQLLSLFNNPSAAMPTTAPMRPGAVGVAQPTPSLGGRGGLPAMPASMPYAMAGTAQVRLGM
jgi:hypothetical protein